MQIRAICMYQARGPLYTAYVMVMKYILLQVHPVIQNYFLYLML